MVALETLPAKLTYEEFDALPNDGQRYELIDGELIMLAGPSISHQLCSGELYVVFRDAITLKRFGWVLTAPTEVKFPGDTAVQPDLIIVLNDRAHFLIDKHVAGPPSLLVEITSMSTRTYDRTTKAALYAANGVPEYWIVDLFTETITIHELRDGRYVPTPSQDIARSHVVPDLAVNVREVFTAARISS